MAHTTRTLALSKKWDLELTDTGKIALKSNAKAAAQNVANECRRFKNDSYFDYDVGIPYFSITLGKPRDNAVLLSYVRKAVLRVKDVAAIEDIELDDFDSEARKLSGTIRFRTTSGGTLNDVEF